MYNFRSLTGTVANTPTLYAWRTEGILEQAQQRVFSGLEN